MSYCPSLEQWKKKERSKPSKNEPVTSKICDVTVTKTGAGALPPSQLRVGGLVIRLGIEMPKPHTFSYSTVNLHLMKSMNHVRYTTCHCAIMCHLSLKVIPLIKTAHR